MALESLPTELLNDIFGRCDKRDIKVLRLTSRRLFDVATDHLLEKFVVCDSEHSIQRAASIGKEHERLAKNVKSLWFHTERIEAAVNDHYWGREVLEDLAEDRTVRPGDGSDTKGKRLKYIALQRLLNDYRQMDESGVIRASLSAFFKACTNLSQLCIGFHEWIPRPMNSKPKYPESVKGVIQPCIEPTAEALIQVLLAAADAKRTIDSLALNYAPLQFWDRVQEMQETRTAQFDDHRRDPPLDDGISWFVRGIEKLQLTLDFRPIDFDEEDDRTFEDRKRHAFYRSGKVISFLRPAANLRLLVLDLDYFIDLEDILGDLKFPNIERLSISNGLANAGYLGKVLLRHRDTLSIAGKLPLLQEFKLRGEFGTIGSENWINRDDRDDRLNSDYTFSLWPQSKHGSLFEKQMSSYIITGIGELPVENDDNKLSSDLSRDTGETVFEFLGGSEDPWMEEQRVQAEEDQKYIDRFYKRTEPGRIEEKRAQAPEWPEFEDWWCEMMEPEN